MRQTTLPFSILAACHPVACAEERETDEDAEADASDDKDSITLPNIDICAKVYAYCEPMGAVVGAGAQAHATDIEMGLEDERVVSKYIEWIRESHGRIGVAGEPIIDQYVAGDASGQRMKVPLDTGVVLSVWVSGPAWMGPYPRTSSDSWENDDFIASDDTPVDFERMLVLARSKPIVRPRDRCTNMSAATATPDAACGEPI